MRNIRAVISDADGTLIDTTYVIRHGQYEAAKQFLTDHGVQQDEIPDYKTYEKALNQVVGRPVHETLESTMNMLYADKPHHLVGINYDDIVKILKPLQDDIASESTVKIYAGFDNLMRYISKIKVKFAIFTSGSPHHIVRNFGVALPVLNMRDLYKDGSMTDKEKVDIFIQKFADEYNLPDFTVVTSVDTKKHKPDPESLQLAMNRLNVTPDQCIVLGDHKVDIQAAANAGIENRVGITHGFDDKLTLVASGATKIIDSLDELPNFLS